MQNERVKAIKKFAMHTVVHARALYLAVLPSRIHLIAVSGFTLGLPPT